MSAPLDVVPGGLISLTNDLRIITANRGMAQLVARSADELVGQPFDVLLSPPSRILFQTHVYPALRADGRVEEVFLTLGGSSGEPTPVLLNAVRDAGDEEPTYHGLVVRIRARARWETDLLEATRALDRERAASQRLADELAAAAVDLEARYAEERRNREFRDAFVGVVSHELRTPITTIYGMSQLLRRRHQDLELETVQQQLQDIEEESDRLRRLTEDLLVLSRAESGRLVLSADPVLIGRVVRDAMASEAMRWTNHHFTVSLATGLPLVLGEDVYLEQVVRNLLSNAAKYSAPGTTIQTAVTEEGGGVAVRIIDAGPGLRGQQPERLFELFYRAPEAKRKAGGAGIGLFVCRELIRAMGGRIWAAAAPSGPGAEFGFWLPAAREGIEED